MRCSTYGDPGGDGGGNTGGPGFRKEGGVGRRTTGEGGGAVTNGRSGRSWPDKKHTATASWEKVWVKGKSG